ncbi:MAG: tetratricopeptide repeat protein [Pirellulales bacterium]
MTLHNSTSAAFRESVALMVKLHDLMTIGDPDGAEADAIRDSMEQPWYAMNSAEQQLIRGLSTDLYRIGQSRTANGKPTSASLQDLQGRVASGDWHELLSLVRENELILSPERVAMLRGLAWANLQLFEPAIEFLQEAIRLSPGDKEARLLLLSCLVQAGRTDEAVRVAAESTDRSTLELATSM